MRRISIVKHVGFFVHCHLSGFLVCFLGPCFSRFKNVKQRGRRNLNLQRMKSAKQTRRDLLNVLAPKLDRKNADDQPRHLQNVRNQRRTRESMPKRVPGRRMTIARVHKDATLVRFTRFPHRFNARDAKPMLECPEMVDGSVKGKPNRNRKHYHGVCTHPNMVNLTRKLANRSSSSEREWPAAIIP